MRRPGRADPAGRPGGHAAVRAVRGRPGCRGDAALKRRSPGVSDRPARAPYRQDLSIRGLVRGACRARGRERRHEVLSGSPDPEALMLEPQSPALFVLLIAMFGVLMWRTLVTRRAAFRALAACLAFVPPMVFGVLAVNKYYGYYQTWGAMTAGLTHAFDRLLEHRLAQPAVLVMPDANGGDRISLQCLNQVGGPQDLTYLAMDLPAQIARMLRVSRPGRAWAVAGYSEGGFCAANMALRYPDRYGFAGVLSGYFTPLDNQLAGTGRPV